jgi:hypothetical protein
VGRSLAEGPLERGAGISIVSIDSQPTLECVIMDSSDAERNPDRLEKSAP